MKYDTWEDKQGGGKRSKMTVVVENFQFLGGREGGGGGGAPSGGGEGDQSQQEDFRTLMRPSRCSGPRTRQVNPPRSAQQPPFGDEQQFKEDDIPF